MKYKLNRKSMKKQLPIILILFILFYGNDLIMGQDQLTLNECLKLAFKSSNIIKIADLSVVLAEKKLAETRSQQLPSLSVNSMYTRISKITSITIPAGPGGEMRTFKFGTPNRINLDIKMQLPAFTWGRISSTIAMSETGKRLSDIQRQQQIINVTDQVLRAFYAILLNREIIRLHEVSEYRARNHLQVAEKRFASGLVPKLELLRARVQLKNSQSSLEEAQSNLAKSKIFLAKIIGRNDENFLLIGKFTYEPFSVNEEQLIIRARKIRSDLQMLQLQQQIDQSQIMLAHSANKLNLFLFSGYNVQNGFDPMDPERFVDNWNVGLQVSFPLFDGFATSYKIQQAKIELQTAKLQEQEIRELIQMQVRQALITIKQSENKIANQKQNILLAKEALQVAETQYQNGLISSLEVLDAQQTLSQSELMYTQAIFNHIMAKLDLCRAIEDYSWFETSLNE